MSEKSKPKVLLLGNGINRCFSFNSWNELLDKIQTKKLTEEELKFVKDIPYTLQPVILTDDNIGNKMCEIAPELCEAQICKNEEKLIKNLVDCKFDNIITTNYTYEIEKSLIPFFNCKVGRACKFRKKTDSKNKYFDNQFATYYDCGTKKVWHMHGEAAKHNTMILGHYYYGKLLSQIQQYIKTLKTRQSLSEKNNIEFAYRNWIDLFLLSDLYIVGFGMNLSELDFWWLINCKKRNFKNYHTYVFKPDITIQEKLLAESYGVKVIEDIPFKNKNYKKYYEQLIQYFNKTME